MLMVLLFIFSALPVWHVSACKCGNRTDELTFCNSDFVAHVEITSQKLVNETLKKLKFEVVEFSVKFVKVYRQNKAKFAKPEKSQKLHSESISSASCGVQLNVSKDAKLNEYLVAGYVTNDKAYVNLCGWVVPWADVKAQLKDSLQKRLFEERCPDKSAARETEKMRSLRRDIRTNLTIASNATRSTDTKKQPKFLERLLKFFF